MTFCPHITIKKKKKNKEAFWLIYHKGKNINAGMSTVYHHARTRGAREDLQIHFFFLSSDFIRGLYHNWSRGSPHPHARHPRPPAPSPRLGTSAWPCGTGHGSPADARHGACASCPLRLLPTVTVSQTVLAGDGPDGMGDGAGVRQDTALTGC